MAKVIKGDKQLAVIVSQKEYDLLAALVGMTNGGTHNDYDLKLWNCLNRYIVVHNDHRRIVAVSEDRKSIDVNNRDEKEY